MSSVAEVKFKAQSGSDILTILQQIKATTRDVGSENAKILRQIREQAKAEAEAAQAAREMAEAQRKGREEARLAAKAIRDKKAEVEKVAKAIKDAAEFTVKWAGNVADVNRRLEDLSGVKSFAEMNKEVNELEEKMVRLGLAMGKSKEQIEAVWGKRGKLVFEVASASGSSVASVTEAVTGMQNQTSMGERFMANGGAVMKSVAKFANVTDASVQESAVAAAQYADKFGLSDKQISDFLSGLVIQQQQGSLEAKTMPKFVSSIVPYASLSGKTGTEGALEMMALANIVLDESGAGAGKNGAATAQTRLAAMFNVLSDTKKRGLLEKGLNYKIMNDKGVIDFQGLIAHMAKMLAEDPVTFNKIMADNVKDSTARKAIVAVAVSGKKNKGTEKDFTALRAPSIEKGKATIETGMKNLLETTNIGKMAEENRNLATATETHETVKPMLSQEHREGNRFRALNPRLAATLGEGQTLSMLSAFSAWGERVGKRGDSLFFGRPKDELGGLQWDKERIQKKIAQFEQNDGKFGVMKMPEELMTRMREELKLVIADIEEVEARRKQNPGQGVVVNNNITIAPNANVEARVTQEAQQSPDRAKAGATPQPRAAGVR